MRAADDLLNRIKLICPVQSSLQKQFASRITQITSMPSAIPPAEGRFAIVTDVGAGCGGRGDILRAMRLQGGFRLVSDRKCVSTRDVTADGEVVWS
jgi:hypothetical protein